MVFNCEGIRTGHDVVMAALLGGEEFGFGTTAMIAAGCVMARVCHLNSCPVGVTTQRPELREKFPGVPEDVVNYFAFVAEEVRWYLAALGCKVRKKRERGKREMGVGLVLAIEM